MTRLLPALLCGILCALLGLRRSREITLRSRRLDRWTSLMNHVALLLQEEADSLPGVLRRAASESGEADGILRALARQLQDQPLLPPNALSLPDDLSPEESAALRRWLCRITQGSRDARVQAARDCGAHLANVAASAREKSASDAKMWRQLGLLGGACLTIWLM